MESVNFKRVRVHNSSTSSSPSSTSKSLPKILFFHGAGSSGAIFKVQARRLVQLLKDDFELIFLDAPIYSSPGPGVLPVFEASGPYRRWQCDISATKEFDITPDEIRAERCKTRKYLAGVFRDGNRSDLADYLDGQESWTGKSESLTFNFNEVQDRAGGIIGVVGFSQGTRVVTGLLAELQRRLREKQDKGADRTTLGDLQGLKFAVLLCGTYGPLPLTDDDDRVSFTPSRHDWRYNTSSQDSREGTDSSGSSCYDTPVMSTDGSEAEYSDASDQEQDERTVGDSRTGIKDFVHDKLTIPSLHVQGLHDPWLPEARQLRLDCYSRAEVLEFSGGHHVPNAQADLQKIRDFIMRMYNA